MNWRKETKSYMWANYYSEDGNWKAWDEDQTVPGGSNRKYYNPKTKTMERRDSVRHIWIVQNIKTGKTYKDFKTLKAAKEFAENFAE